MSRTDHLAALLPGLTPVEVFDFYDGPRFYSCRDVVGQLYVVYWIDEGDDKTSWLYFRVSPERYTSLKQGFVTIAFALSNPEEGYAFVVHITSDGVSIDEVQAEQIDPEWLPPIDERLSVVAITLPERSVSAVEAAKSGNRQVFDLAFQKNSNTYEMGCGKLGRLLDAVQSTVFAFACAPNRDIRRVPEEVKFNNEVLVTDVFASSFGIRLKTKGADLFSNDDSARALQTLTELIAVLSVPETLSSNLHRLNILGRSRFKHLLRVMVDAEISVTADWGAPSGTNRQAHASYSEISRALQELEATDDATTRTVERSGRLVGVDVQSNFFALVANGTEVIKGTLTPSIAQQRFEVPSQVRATIEETCVVDPLTDREKWTYVLLAVSRS